MRLSRTIHLGTLARLELFRPLLIAQLTREARESRSSGFSRDSFKLILGRHWVSDDIEGLFWYLLVTVRQVREKIP